MTAPIRVSRRIIRNLLEGDTVCPDCAGNESTTFDENCLHRQAELEAVLDQFYVTVYVPWRVNRDTPAIEWPTRCGNNCWPACLNIIDECPICGLDCECPMTTDSGPYCAACVIEDDCITLPPGPDIDDILMAGLTGQIITIYRRPPNYEQPALFWAA